MRLAQSDAEAILRFLGEVDRLDAVELYPVDLLSLIAGLVPAEEVVFQDADVAARKFQAIVPAGADEEDARYWLLGPCPIADYRVRTGDLAAVRMSDVIGRNRYHGLPIYRDYFHPAGMEYVLDLGLWSGPDRYRSVVLLREASGPDFSEREREITESLRPHLRAREARIQLLRAAAQLPPAEEEAQAPRVALTIREREVLRLVGQGKTNAEIAADLWVSPATVKKHLENVYLKLGVAKRAAAATRLHGVG